MPKNRRRAKLQLEFEDGEIVTCLVVQEGLRRVSTQIDGEWPHQLDRDQNYDLESFVFYAKLYSQQLRGRRGKGIVRARLIYEGEREDDVRWRTLHVPKTDPG